MEKMERTSVLLPKNYLREIDSMAKEQGLDSATLIRQLLIAGIKKYKIQLAVELYRTDKNLSRQSRGACRCFDLGNDGYPKGAEDSSCLSNF